jgi:hypothetical protein
MNRLRLGLATLVVLTVNASLRGDDKVLVPGDPPLTQETVNVYQEMWEWYCEIKLTPAERQKHTQLFITFWKKKPPTGTKPLLDSYGKMEKVWRGVLELKGAEQQRKRAEMRTLWMTNLRKSTDPVDRLLVSVYDEAYKPGGTRNAILVRVDPPLTQGMVDLDMAVVELILDFRLTDRERDEYQRLFIELWKKLDRDERRKRVGILEKWGDLPGYNNYTRTVKRTLLQPNLVPGWTKQPSDQTRWLTTVYESVFKPGSDRNPIRWTSNRR